MRSEVKAKEQELEGQMSIFDFPEYLPEGADKRRAEMKKQNEGDPLSPAQEYYVRTGKTDYWQNRFAPVSKDIETMTIEEAAKILNNLCGLSLKPSNFFFDDGAQLYKCRKKKFKFGLNFGRFLGGKYVGKRFLSVDIEADFGKYCSVGYADLTIEEAAGHITKVLETGVID